MRGLLPNAQRAFVYQEVELSGAALLRLRGAPGLEVRADASALCVTIDRRLHAFADVGCAYRIRGGATAIVRAFRATRVVLTGEVLSRPPWRVELLPRRGAVIVLAQERPRWPRLALASWWPASAPATPRASA